MPTSTMTGPMAGYHHYSSGMEESSESESSELEDDLMFKMDRDGGEWHVNPTTPSVKLKYHQPKSSSIMPPGSPSESKLSEVHLPRQAPPKKQQRKRNIGPCSFNIEHMIGEGGYGKVYLVRDRHEPKGLSAMKVLEKATIAKSAKDVVHTNAELSILSKINSPFLCKMFHSFQTVDKLYLVLQYCSGGDLFTHLDHFGVFSEDFARFYACELTLALEHLHSLGIVYRDLKPENILLDVEGHVVLTDFGLSKEGMAGDSKTYSLCGTYEYMAPEIITRVGHSIEVDWYALGALLYDMTAGRPPFKGDNKHETMELILHGRPAYLMYLSPEFNDVLQGLLTKTVHRRLGSNAAGGVERLKNQKWFKAISWDGVGKRGLQPPIVPTITTPTDVSNFDSALTSMTIVQPEPSAQPGHSATHDSMFPSFDWVNDGETDSEEELEESTDPEMDADDHTESEASARSLRRIASPPRSILQQVKLAPQQLARSLDRRCIPIRSISAQINRTSQHIRDIRPPLGSLPMSCHLNRSSPKPLRR